MLLDTTVLIDAFHRRPGILGRLRATPTPMFASVVSLDELLFGMRKGEEARIRALLEGLHLLPFGEPEARLASTWRREYALAGTTTEPRDCYVAATAASSGLTLATANIRHFPMSGLHVEHWPSE